MTLKDIIDQMVPLFREVLDADDIELDEETTAESIIEWDSLNHVQLLHRIEEHFGVDIPESEASTFNNVGDMARAIARKLESSNAPRTPEKPAPESGALPPELSDMLRAFQKSRAILTGIELQIFDAVGQGATAQTIAQRTGAHPRGMEMLLDALVALGLLLKSGETYSNGDVAKNYLVQGAPHDSRAALMHTVHLWNQWSALTDSVRKGKAANPADIAAKEDAWTEAFIAAMHKNGSLRAPAVIAKIDLEGVQKILDLGGGSGAYSIAFAKARPEAAVTLLDLPNVAPLARRYVGEQEVLERISITEGNLFQDSYGDAEYDLVFASAICHMLSPEQNLEVFVRMFKALRPGGKVVLQDFVLENDKTQPEHGVLFALNMLVSTEGGSSYSAAEYASWLSKAGFVDAKKVVVGGPTDLMAARRPENR